MIRRRVTVIDVIVIVVLLFLGAWLLWLGTSALLLTLYARWSR